MRKRFEALGIGLATAAAVYFLARYAGMSPELATATSFGLAMAAASIVLNP